MILYLSLAVASSALMALGLVMMKSRAEHLSPAVGARIASAILAWLRDPMWSGGLGVQLAGWALYLISVSHAPVSMVAVMMQGGIAMFIVMSVLVLGERATGREWIGIGAIVVGMILLAASISSDETSGMIRPWQLFAITAVLGAGGLAAFALDSLRESGAATAIASGIAFGLGSLFTKAMTDSLLAPGAGPMALRIAANGYVYIVIIANIAGIVLLQNAFFVSRGIVALPLSSGMSNLVPIAGGMIVFGERLPAEPVAAAMRIGAFVLTIAAGALLAGTHERRPPIAIRPA